MQTSRKPETVRVKLGRPATRGPRQHRELLDAVSRKINTDGAGSVVLADIGSAVGLSRSSLYYYCSDPADLVHQAYMSSCRQLLEDLESACASVSDADAQIEAFIRKVLHFRHAPVAALNDLDFLSTERQQDVHQAVDELETRIAKIIVAGQKQGCFRSVDASMCAPLILNILSWALISLPWLERRDDAEERARYIDAICDILLNGIAATGRTASACGIRYADLMKREINAFDRLQAADLKSDQIVAAASRLFNLKGLDGVRLDEVCVEIGASKGAIYHHFKNKDDLIARCYDRAFDIYELIMETGMTRASNSLDRAAIVTHLNAQAQLDQNAPLALQPGLGKLSGKKRAALKHRAQKLGDIGRESLEAGIQAGSCRPHDTEYAPEIMAGYFLGIPRWTNTESDTFEIADRVTGIALYGLRNRE